MHLVYSHQTRSWSVEKDKICYSSQLKHLDVNTIVLGKHVRPTSFLKPKPSSLWEWTNVTNNNHCVIFIFFSVYVTSFYYFTVVYILYTCIRGFLLINLMKTGIGQSKYCIHQPFSRCLISLCSSLFYFNSILKQWGVNKVYVQMVNTLLFVWRQTTNTFSCSWRSSE